MFKRIESQLRIQGKTKVWFADVLDESTQNINNWKKRGVPAAKVKRISEVLCVSREYLESGEGTEQRVATPSADYVVKVDPNKIRPSYNVFVDLKDEKVAKLLQPHLKSNGDLNYLDCAAWNYSDPFVAVDIWQGKGKPVFRVFLRHDCIVGITDHG